MHEAFVVIHVVDRFGGVHHLPHDDRGDLDRAAIQFVDLEPATFEITYALADLFLAEEGVVPAQAVVLHRTHVLAEQAEHGGLVGLYGVQADQAEEGDHAYPQARDQPHAVRLNAPTAYASEK